MKKRGILLVVVLLAVLSGCGEARDPDTAAVYGDLVITQSMLEPFRGEGMTDREVVERLVENKLLQEEAEARGLTASEEEIEEFLADTVYASYEIPEGKEMIDEYCAGAGLSFEEYVETVRQVAPRTIARAKLENAIAEEYCQAHGLEYDSMNPAPEVKAAVERYKEDLFAAHKEEIVYYIP